MSRQLPENPNLEHLKNQAKELLRELRGGEAGANAKLAEAQFAIAREYGFASWTKLKEHVEEQTADPPHQLKAAIEKNDAARVERVLERFPELKARLNDPLPGYAFGQTALIAAIPWTNREMIDVLLRGGADINGRSQWWAGSFGVMDDDRGLAPFLMERGATVDVHAAARLGMMDRLRELVEADPPLVHARGGDGQTPLHFAKSVEVAEYLLTHGAEIDVRDIDHESTPAQYMVRDRQEVARYLVQRGCRTDILMASALGDLELVRRHLDANPESIRTTVSEKYFPKVDPRAGGTIYTWTLGSNKTAHTVAREFGHENIFQFLMDRSALELKMALACELGDEGLFREMLAGHPELARNLSDEDRSRLVNAAQSNNTAAVRLMLEAGWPTDVRGQHPGGTALHWAAWHGNLEMVRDLVRHGAPLEIVDTSNGVTPVNWAVHGSENGWHRKTGDYAGVVEALLDAGAKAPQKIEGSNAVVDVLSRRVV